jgi:hypothetical protein
MGATNRALATDLPITLVTLCQLVSLYVKFVRGTIYCARLESRTTLQLPIV